MRGWNYTARLNPVTAFLALLCLAQPANAIGAGGSDSLLRIGQRVRVDYDTTVTKHILYVIPWSSREIQKTTGRLVSWASDTIVIASDQLNGNPRAFPEWAVRKLYVADGRRRATAEGIGFGAMAGLFPMLAAIMGDRPLDANIEEFDRRRFRAGMISLGIPVLIGGVIGWFTKVDRWKEADKRNWPFQLGLSNQSDGFGLNLTYSF